MEELKDHLKRGFDYDLWATLRWLQWIESMPGSEHAREIMTHMAWAQHIWLVRLERVSGEFPHDAPLAEVFENQAAIWKRTVDEMPLDQVHFWKRLDGTPKQGTLLDIAHHVINHGTYHRGHLRGLADAAGFEGFEDTDFARYFDSHQL